MLRGPHSRLPAETIRDQALSVAGLLTEKVGRHFCIGAAEKLLSKGRYNADMRFSVKRGKLTSVAALHNRETAPFAAAHDGEFGLGPARNLVKQRTDTPLQALNLMNDVTFVEAARFLGQRMMKEGGTRHNPFALRFSSGTRRATSQAEQQILSNNLRYHLDYFAGKATEIDAFLSQGDARPDPSLDRRELAAFACRGERARNLDEMVTERWAGSPGRNAPPG